MYCVFLHSEIDLLPLRMFSVVPIFLSVSIVIGYIFLLDLDIISMFFILLL